jgi:hypothetical protein
MNSSSDSANAVEKGVQSPDLVLLEDRDIHSGDDRSSSTRSEVPVQAAVIVVHLCRICRPKHESRRCSKDFVDLCVKGVTTNDPRVGFKEDTGLGIELADGDLAALGIPLAEHLMQIPFHQVTEWVAHSGTSYRFSCSCHRHVPATQFLVRCQLLESKRSTPRQFLIRGNPLICGYLMDRAVGDLSPMVTCRQQTPVAKGIAETFMFGSCQSRRASDRAHRKGFVVV